MGRKPITSRSEIEALLKKGFTQEEIAKMKGITQAGVSWHLRHSGGAPSETLVERIKKSVPWQITGTQQKARPYREILYHLEYRETGGNGMSEEKLRRLRGFYRKLTDFSMVVRYDPKIPPRPGQKFGLFEYVPREERDGDLILRIDKNTRVPDTDRAKWTLPAREEWPE
jgi:transcriptional regulator with XRE-family HTH domain